MNEKVSWAAQIHWLSELEIFNFEIKYQTNMSSKTADTLSHLSPDSGDLDEVKCDEYKMASYATVCEDITNIMNGENFS